MTGPQAWLQHYLHLSQYWMETTGILLLNLCGFLIYLTPWHKRQRERIQKEIQQ